MEAALSRPYLHLFKRTNFAERFFRPALLRARSINLLLGMGLLSVIGRTNVPVLHFIFLLSQVFQRGTAPLYLIISEYKKQDGLSR